MILSGTCSLNGAAERTLYILQSWILMYDPVELLVRRELLPLCIRPVNLLCTLSREKRISKIIFLDVIFFKYNTNAVIIMKMIADILL